MVDVCVRGVRETATAYDLDQAIELREKMLYAMGAMPRRVAQRRKAAEAAGPWTLKVAFDKACEKHWREDKANAWVQLRRNAEEVCEYLGWHRRMDTITIDDIDKLIATLRKQGKAAGTINRKTAALSKLYRTAIDHSHISGITHKPKAEHQYEDQDGRIRFLSLTEEATFLDILTRWSKDEHVEAFTVLIDTGLRPSELWRVTARDIDWTTGKDGLLMIWSTSKKRTKNKKSRAIPMTPRVSAIMKARAERYPTGPLFMVKDGNNPERVKVAGNYWFSEIWDKVREHMGLAKDPEFVPYALRHTFASRLIQRGVRIETIQKLLGHENIRMTQRYAKLAPENLIEAIGVLNQSMSA